MSRLSPMRPTCNSYAILLAASVLSAVAAPVGAETAKLAMSPKSAASAVAATQARAANHALPLVFEENAGQLPVGTAFAGRTSDYTVQVRPKELRFSLPEKGKSRTITMDFAGGAEAKAVGVSDAGFRTNFYLSPNPADWHTNVRNYNRVALKGLYPGIDAQFYATGSNIEHDFIVAPGADATKLMMQMSGAKSANLSPAGDVLLAAEGGALRLEKPRAYQVLPDGSRTEVAAEFVLTADGPASVLTFRLGKYDHTRELVIDPVITFATYVAGDKGSIPAAIASDASGNVYLTGTTQSTSATFGASSTTLDPPALTDPSTVFKVAFIARVSRATAAGAPVNGSQIAWLTYYGQTSTSAAPAGNAGDTTATSIAVQPQSYQPVGATGPSTGTLLYIAGQTTATGLPGSTNGGTATLSNGGKYGFIADFNEADGTAASTSNAVYVDGGGATQAGAQTILQALTVDSTGSVTAVGNSTGTQYSQTPLSLGLPSGLTTLLGTLGLAAPTSFCTTAGLGTTADSKGLLTTFPQALGTPTYSTYICGAATPSASSTYTVTGVSVTPGTPYATYVVTGSTNLDFPESGPYDQPTANSTNTAVTFPTFYTPGAAGKHNAFAASLSPSTFTVNWSYWSNGANDEFSNGLTIDTSVSPANVVVFGTTTSNLAGNSQVSSTQAGIQTSPTPGYNTFSGNSQQVGFAVGLNTLSGSFGGVTYLEADGTSAGTTLGAAAADGAGNILFAGSTSSSKGAFPAAAASGALSQTSRPASVGTLPAAQDSSLNPTGAYAAGYLVRMPSTLASADYVAFFGPGSASGSSTGVGVAIDAADTSSLPGAASAPLAYVLLNETTGGSHSYTTSSAEEQVPQSGATNAAYLAQVGFVAPTGTASFTYTASAASYTPKPVGYSAQGQSSLTITWPVQVAAAGTSQLVFNLPQSKFLSTYSLSELSVMVGTGSNIATNVCTLGVVNASANPAANSSAVPPVAGPGITCVIPSVPAATGGTTVTFQIAGVPVSSSIPSGIGSFPVSAAAYDATGVGYDLTQTIVTAGIPSLSVNVVATPSLVNAATSATQADAAGNLVTVTYTYTITNASANDSPNTKLVTGLNTTTAGTTLLSNPVTTSSAAAGCDPTTATNGCDVPANGTLTYTVKGVYLDSNFATSGTGPFTVTQGRPYVTFSYPLTNIGQIYTASATGPSVQVNGTTTITANALTTNQPTYANHTSFQLGDQDVELTASFTNSGKDQAGTYTASVTLPMGYTATASSCPGATTPFTSCTFANIAPGQTVSYTITGRFEDTGAATDAVSPPNTAGPSAAAVQSSQTSNTVSATLNTVTTGTTTGTYLQSSPLPAATPIKVTRVNALTYAIGATTPLSSNTVNELGPLHATFTGPNDTLTYGATVRNTGTSVARGIYFVIPVPNAPSGTVPAVTIGAITYSTGMSAANQLTCGYVSAQGGVVCYENDLAPGAAATTTPHPTTSAQTYSISFTASYDESAVPQNVKMAQVTQGNGAIYAAADTYNPAGGLSVPATVTSPAPAGSTNVITIQRLTSIVSNVSVSAVGSAAATNYADKTHVTLDSNPGGNSAGTFDTILLQSSTSNMGPDDAAGLIISIPIPALTRVAIPQYCTLNGVTGPSTTLITVTAASTMTCATPSFTTVAATAGNQLRAGAAACGAAPTPSGAAISAVTFDSTKNCLAVAFFLKFSDSPTVAGTVVGSAASATVGYSGASVAENDVDTPSTPAPTTTAAVTTVQRAAHIRLSAPLAVPTYTTGAALTLDPSGTPEVAQAALHMDPATRLVTTGKVYNCLRYGISVVNDGPNYVLNPTLSYSETPTTFVPTRVSTGTAPTDISSVNCAPQTLPTSTVLSPLAAGTAQSAFIDGYFDVGSLVAANFGTASFATGNFSLAGYNDSNTVGTAAADYSSTRTISLVNTPYTDPNNQKFGITAYGTTPQATLIFTSVSAPGITSAFTANSVNCTAPTYDANHLAPPGNVNICFPYGKSPLPADNGVVRNLYQPGKTPQYYQIPTTAAVPTTAGNATSVCFTMTGGSFPDVFVKPERTLLWLLANASAGTTYNTFPTSYTTFTSPLAAQAGDVTAALLPYLPSATSPSYLRIPAAFTFPQIPQAQPMQICGTVNGFVTTTTADTAAVGSAETFGLLEPVNFPPVAVAGSVAASSSVSKGSTSALSDIYLRRSVVTAGVVTTKYTYDYNDSDPCYIASSPSPRQTCDDNPYLFTVTFTGGNSTTAQTAPALVATLPAESVTSAPPSSYNVATNINLSTSTNVFVSVADQATGADAYNTDVATAPGYTGNPFIHQGNFLSGSYSIASHSSQPPLCDPGTSAVGGYNTVGVACAGGVGGNVSGQYRYIRGGQKSATVPVNYAAAQDLAGGYYVLGNVGAQSVTASNLAGSGLIPLPYPAPDPTAPAGAPAPTTTNPQNPGGSPSTPLGADATSKATTAAIASITAGQTAGFVWPWLSSVTQSQGIPNGALANDKYDLACFLVDSATQQTPQSFPTGVTCNISTTTPNSATASPTVYTFADPSASPANGSSSPTIYITTAGGTLYGAISEPAWKRGAEGLALAMLFPVLFFRKRLGRGATLAIVMLMMAAAPLLSGCGTGGSASTVTGPTTPAGNYLFRVTATPESTAHGEAKITSAVFEVSIH